MLERVTVVGLGTIGMRWAVAFAHAGVAVRSYDADPSAWKRFETVRDTLLDEIGALKGAQSPPAPITFHASLAEAADGAEFVQENVPERIELKRDLLPEIEKAVDDDVVIASSSSALLVSDIQRKCRRPERVVLGHPFNPAHLMPLVEIVGGAASAPWAVDRARGLYEAIGKEPVILRREVAGHLALRMMGAMWREAISLIVEGVATAEDIDRAFCFGPGPKWCLQGSFISNHLGAADMADFLEKYGSTYQAIWDDLRDVKLDDETRRRVAEETRRIVGGRSDAALREERDSGLVEILRIQARHGAFVRDTNRH